MLAEPKTHPHNLEIVGKVSKALFNIVKNSLEGANVLRQPISGIQIHVIPSKSFQNVAGDTEPELALTLSFIGSTSKSFRFKFSDLVDPAVEVEAPPLNDPTIPDEEPKRADN